MRSGYYMVSGRPDVAAVLAWAAINMAATYREAQLLLAEDPAIEPEVVAQAQRIVARVAAQGGAR